jgi:DNA-binding NarL/FixJ family response regulator
MTAPNGTQRPLRVLIVDDERLPRQRLLRLLEEIPGTECVGECQNGRSAVDAIESLLPDLVLLDVRMPEMDGIETARRLRAVHPDGVVVLISVEQAPELPSSVTSVGAAAYLCKQQLSTRTLRELWAQHQP